jgi:SAM-dependent methyltransferase
MSLPDLDHLRCPDCRGKLQASPTESAPAFCPRCHRDFVLDRGVLDLAPASVEPLTGKTVEQFGASWQIHPHLASYQEKQLQDWMTPLPLEALSGKTVLEAGCGKGRHSIVMAEKGPEHLYAVDLSDAVLLAADYTAELENTACIRANLLKLPFGDGTMDVVVCVGVLHHLEDPQAGLSELWRVLKPGGTLCLWVYGREGNGWIVHILDPIRTGVTSRIPTPVLRPLIKPLAGFLYLLLKGLYGPSTGWGKRTRRWLPYSSYLGYISKFPYREIEHIILDHLCPPIAYYLSRPTLENWFERLGGAEAAYRWHNKNSWNVVARKSTGT